jgi:hypothetical protein
LILQTLQEDVEIEKDLNNLSSLGVKFNPAGDIDDSLSTFSTNPSILTLRQKIYEQDKRKKYIKKKMATLTGVNPIYNNNDFDEKLKSLKNNQKSLDNMVLDGKFDQEQTYKLSLENH